MAANAAATRNAAWKPLFRAAAVASPEAVAAVRARSGKAGQDSQAERAAHHEGRVDDPGGEARFGRGDVAHRGHEDRVEGDPACEAEEQHAGQNIEGEVAVHWSTRKQEEAEQRRARAPRSMGTLTP